MVLTLLAVGFLLCALLAVVRTPEEPGRSRIAVVVAAALATPALFVLVLILKDGSRDATMGELAAVAIYTVILSVASSIVTENH
ncbi:hypothetical protein [Corynebacterium bovis]|uniref:hypothetical protein n=1 Tax=Corynebacterium bovis TaxID=36808 RepID=UPI0031389B58